MKERELDTTTQNICSHEHILLETKRGRVGERVGESGEEWEPAATVDLKVHSIGEHDRLKLHPANLLPACVPGFLEL